VLQLASAYALAQRSRTMPAVEVDAHTIVT